MDYYIPHQVSQSRVNALTAAAVGPAGTQSVVVVIEPKAGSGLKPGLAPLELGSSVRAAVAAHFTHDIAAVLLSPTFPRTFAIIRRSTGHA